ncbi:MAG: ATP-binding cassette domain-containing protein [Gemmatimonadales bacterium]|nr:ATP-binding cassette domain-containing protein [Gemmatimonadales bacterium]NIN13356.1 ATP-binding cassette domain-containing protein [Gemmatimonadales bacterium]NIN51359.1 ATP-binding cassette domain-containing protein [Gemmatimonadales bacterium]NIP08823.1 ATP-binding cassette domain-containing protein [Gemmatimonadales bacterium]NIQ99817.1 ATP-binding cassette domain-containing protein [Gemmatimonadales bacterium]
MAEPFLQLSNLTKRFGEHVAVEGLTLSVPRASVLALLGPSGSGKTTTLRLLAGFDKPDRGTVTVDGQDVTAQSPAARRFGMVFQHYALFPHLTVGENVAFGLARRGTAEERRRRVEGMLSLVDLEGFADRQVSELSGGQQQRVAVARALAPEPRVLLLDEPLSNLDPSLRERTRRELRAALEKVGITTVLVTHEQEEAFALGDRVAVLRDGRLQQVGTAPDLYERPETLFVARFVGRASVLRGVMTADNRARLEGGVEWAVETGDRVAAGTPVAVVVRPEAVRFAETGVAGTVVGCRYVGARALFAVDVASGTVEVEASVRAAHVGDVVHVAAERALAFAEEAE